METEERFALIKQVGEEVINDEELLELLRSGKQLIAYDGFEPSGKMHIAQGLMRAINVNKMTKAGVHFIMWVADWHGWANNKLGGDIDKIQTTGKYMIEVWKACGMDLSKVEFRWVSDVVKDPEYWKLVMQVSRHSTLNRIIRCGQIMGRKEGEVMQASQILYPCMQAADIFYLKADICQLGMDQRKVNMLARELAEKLGYAKPVIVSHHMLMGLGQPPAGENTEDRVLDLKMSKSKPDTAIFMTDSSEDIKRKINKAYCPEGQVAENPILEYCKHIIFEKFDTLVIERPDKWGGNLTFGSYAELEKSFSEKQLHPMDLKKAVAARIDELIKPVRDHFENDANARELFEKVKSYEITR